MAVYTRHRGAQAGGKYCVEGHFQELVWGVYNGGAMVEVELSAKACNFPMFVVEM